MGEESNLKYFNELPFQTLTNYDIENDFISGKRKFANLMNNENFQTIITEIDMNNCLTQTKINHASITMKANSSLKIEMAMTSLTCFL